MAYRERGMVEVREMVRRWLGGEGIRAIARATGMDRKTVAAYVRAARTVGIQRDGRRPPTRSVANSRGVLRSFVLAGSGSRSAGAPLARRTAEGGTAMWWGPWGGPMWGFWWIFPVIGLASASF